MASLESQGWTQRFTITLSNTGSGVAQTDFVTRVSQRAGANSLTNIIPYSVYVGDNRASSDGRCLRITSDSAGNTEVPVHVLSWNNNLASGTTTSATTNKLVCTGQTFTTSVEVGDRVFNVTNNTTAIITAIDSNTQLSLDADIFPTIHSARVFRIVRSVFLFKSNLTTTTSTMYGWVGNTNATLPATNATYGRNNVYNATANPYLAIWHLNEPTIGDTAINSATQNIYDGTSAGTNKPSSTTGKFFRGQFFSGNNSTPAVEDRFDIVGSNVSQFQGANTTPPTAFTWSGTIIASGSTGTTQKLFGKRDQTGTFIGYDFQIGNSPKKLQFVMDYGASQYNVLGSTTLNTTDFYDVMVSMPSNGVPADVIITVNGVAETCTVTMSGTTVDTGTTTAGAINATLIQTGQNFLTTCAVGNIVLITSGAESGMTGRVLSVDSNTQLTIDRNILPAVFLARTFQVYAVGNVNHTSERFGLGSQEGASSYLVYEGTMEGASYINGVQMSVNWALSKYNNIFNISTFVVMSSATTYNQFPSAWDLTKVIACTSKSTHIRSTQTGFIPLINQQQTVDTDFWSYVQSGGGNIRFATNLDGTGQIPLDMAYMLYASQLVSLFTKDTMTLGGGDVVYIFYKSTNTVYQPHFETTYGRNNVYATKVYPLVIHGNEQGNGTALEYIDSSGSGNDGQGTVAPNLVNAVIDKGQQGNGTTMKITTGNNLFPYGKTAATMSAWAIFDGTTSEQTTIAYGNDADGQRRVLQQRSDGCGGHISNAFWGVTNLYNGKTHVAWLFPTDAGTLTINETRMFINGEEMLTSSAEPFKLKLLTGTNLTINTVDSYKQLMKGGGGAFSTVPMEEFRITLSELTPDWIHLEYANQLDTKNLWGHVALERNYIRGSLRGHLRGTSHG